MSNLQAWFSDHTRSLERTLFGKLNQTSIHNFRHNFCLLHCTELFLTSTIFKALLVHWLKSVPIFKANSATVTQPMPWLRWRSLISTSELLNSNFNNATLNHRYFCIIYLMVLPWFGLKLLTNDNYPKTFNGRILFESSALNAY